MPEGMVAAAVPEVHVGDSVQPPTKAPIGEWTDMAADLERISRETGQPMQVQAEAQGFSNFPQPMPGPGGHIHAPQLEPNQQQAQPAKPETPNGQAPATATAQDGIPDKFRAPDGSLDKNKLLKSYLDAEKELKRAQQRVAQPYPNGQVQQQQQASVADGQSQFQRSAFAAQLEQDWQQLGGAVVLERLFNAAVEAGHQRSVSEIRDVRDKSEDYIRRMELEAIAQSDPWVISPQGYETMVRIRQERPWVNSSPEPWRQAYREHLADQELARRTGQAQQVRTPTPQAMAAPQGPATAAGRPLESVTRLETREDILAHVSRLTPEQEKQFWSRMGYKF